MKAFRDWSIRHKLTGLLVTMACITAVAVSMPMGIFDYLGLRRAMARDLATLADVLARNSTAALTSRNADAARDVLQALRAEPSVTAACIYTEDGEPFARYVRQGNVSDFAPPLAQDPLTRFEGRHLIQFRRIVLDGEIVGTIYVESDLLRLEARLREYALAFLATLLLALFLALVIASRLQRPISGPLVELVRTAEAVSLAPDYSIRANLPNRDEFGLLVSAFNGMLDQIEQRDEQLQQHREQREEEVASRTAELLTANTQLRRTEETYRSIFEDAVVGIFQITPEGRPLNINRALAQMHGFDSPGQFLAEVSNVAAELFVEPRQMLELSRALDEHGVVRGVEVQVYRRDKTKKWVLATMRAVRDAAGNILFHEGTVEDITDRKRAEERVEFLAYYDALTGLPNRRLLQDRLAKALAAARRRSDKVALLFLDLDGFKNINDSLGHSFGDLLLQDVAERLRKWVRAQDTVARIGGDEFLIALTGAKDVPGAAIAAERIMDIMTAKFVIQGRSFTVNCSIGISIFPEHGADGETLIKNADAAMYAAKESGRNTFRFFSEDMNAQVVERLTLEHGLRTALDKQELFLVYQSQVELATGRIVGFEALLRWQHPELGLVSPDRFIRVAENSGLIIPIGEWVLRTACSTARQWQEQGFPPVPMAVNVSAVQFRQESFRELISRVLQETGLQPQYLELELIESLLLSNADVTLSVLRGLKTMGVKFTIDDFGTGYSSLSYLRQFPVSKLKIDRSFIQDVAVNSDDAAITTAIISMAKGLNLRVIAEGVENETQMSFLRTHHCDEVQGYYFSKPITADQVAEQLRARGLQALSAQSGQ
jgi:diguanylate cyclase (GGDEF)-like protein/PAS domain S-box-containing protein